MLQFTTIGSYCVSVYSDTSAMAYYWTDLRETTGSVPGSWEWGDGTSLNYNQWRHGEPSSSTERRAILYKVTTLLWDTTQTSNRHVICEK